jgi:hypothetical protein
MSLIPKVIYQSWRTKSLYPALADNVDYIKRSNPEYDYRLYDDDDCRAFLLQHFGVNYVNAFDSLIPGAFKCDFWRYAVLYVNGGVYLDMDLRPMYRLGEILNLTDTFVSCCDRETSINFIPGIYQAFIACKPKHPILLQALQIAYVNISTRRISVNTLDITGPTVMANAFNLYFNKKAYEKIECKDYGGGVRLFKMIRGGILDINGTRIFDDKYEGYMRGDNDYSKIAGYYVDTPYKQTHILEKIFVTYNNLLVLILLVIIGVLWYKLKKSRKCML